MIDQSAPSGSGHSASARPVTLRFAAAASIHLPLVGAIAMALAPAGSVWPPLGAMAAFALASIWAGTAFGAGYPHRALGLANIVTLSRLALAAALVAPLAWPSGLAWPDSHAWAMVGVAVLALCLDGIDGRLARRQNLVSAFGARFDMEVDAFFAALLSLLLLQSGKVGVGILALGFTRYAFVAAAVFLPWLGAPLSDSLRRKAVCVLQIGTLVILLSPVVPPHAAMVIAAASTAALAWSFGTDIAWLWRHRR